MEKMKVNDEVVVLAGKDKGKTGTVLRVNKKTETVLIKGINMVKKCLKASNENPTGGIIDVERPIHISNVSMISPKTKKPTRVRITTVNGKKVRQAVACKSIF
jgi:large subunit ribosomal protein L24